MKNTSLEPTSTASIDERNAAFTHASPRKRDSLSFEVTGSSSFFGGEECIEMNVSKQFHQGKSVDTTADETIDFPSEEESFRVSRVDSSHNDLHSEVIPFSDDDEKVADPNNNKVGSPTKKKWKWAKKPLSRITRRIKSEPIVSTQATMTTNTTPETKLDDSFTTLTPIQRLNTERSILNITDETDDTDADMNRSNIDQRRERPQNKSVSFSFDCHPGTNEQKDCDEQNKNVQHHNQCSAIDDDEFKDVDPDTSALSNWANSFTESFVDNVCSPLEDENGFISRAVASGGCAEDVVLMAAALEKNNACFASLGDVIDSAAKSIHSRIESDMECLLGSNEPPCAQELDLFRVVSSIWDGCDKNDEKTNECDTDQSCCKHNKKEREGKNKWEIKPSVRNRAGETLKARAAWIRKMRKQRTVANASLDLGSIDHIHRHHASPLCIGDFGDESEMIIRQSQSMDEHYVPTISTNTTSGFGLSMDGSFLGLGPSVGVIEDTNEHTDVLSRMIGDCVDPIPIMSEGDEEWKPRYGLEEEDDLCYDSDPGADCQERLDRKRHRNGNFGTKAIHQDLKNSESVCSEGEPSPDMNQSYLSLTSENCDDKNFDDAPCDEFEAENSIRDEVFVSQILHESFNKTWTLIWHPLNEERKAGDISSLPSPKCVEVWFEKGCSIHGHTEAIEPKLMWREAHQLDIANNRQLNATAKQPHNMAILTICRILEMDALPSSPPSDSFFTSTKKSVRSSLLAKRSCSFVLRNSFDEEFLFEARSEAERDEIVHDWKLVVARLASYAITGNGTGMINEFFMTEFGVPGGLSFM